MKTHILKTEARKTNMHHRVLLVIYNIIFHFHVPVYSGLDSSSTDPTPLRKRQSRNGQNVCMKDDKKPKKALKRRAVMSIILRPMASPREPHM